MVFREKYKQHIREANFLKVRSVDEENYSSKIKGEVIDTWIYPDGTRVPVRDPDHNLVVSSCSVLIAALMKGEAGYSGIKYWAVGSGSDLWTNNPPPSPDISDAGLTTETFRKLILPEDIVYLDPNDNVVVGPTRKIQITVTFLEDEANGPLREFALVGGLASDTPGSGIILNHKIHAIIWKTDGLQFERILRFTF